MFLKHITKNVVAALTVGGVLALSQLATSSLASASPAISERAFATNMDYPPGAVTNTDLTLDRNTVRPGQRNTARAAVSSDEGTPQGTVTFRVSGHDSETVALVNGKATYDMPRDLEAGRTYQVTATYNGNDIYKKSRDSESVTVEGKGNDEVKGREGERDKGNGNAGSGSGGDGSAGESGDEVKGVEAERDASGDLPDTGADENSQLYVFVGLGLLAAGAVSLLMWRRRTR